MFCEIKTFCWNCPAFANTYLRTKNKIYLADHCQEKKQKIIEAIKNV